MKATAANSVIVAASGYWPFGLAIEATPSGLLLKPARQPRAGWTKAFRKTAAEKDPSPLALRNSPNEFDRQEWHW